MAKSRIIKELASGKVSVEIGLKQLKVLLNEFNKPQNTLNGSDSLELKVSGLRE